MITYIRKRNGKLVSFDEKKITKAIKQALKATGTKADGQELSNLVLLKLEEKDLDLPTVELVQDTVEEVLIEQGYVRVAKAYILYRADRTKARQIRSELMTNIEEITFGDKKSHDLALINENDSIMRTMLRYGQEASFAYNRLFILSPDLNKALDDGLIYIHGLDFYTIASSSSQIDLDKVFTGGFKSGIGEIREPNSITSYASLATLVIQSNQNDQYGEQIIANFDYTMAKGVRKSYTKTYYKYLEELLYILDLQDGKKIIQDAIDDKVIIDMANTYNHQNYFINKLKEIKINHAKDFVQRLETRVIKAVEKESYQAIESFIHSLNAMHTRIGGIVPQSVINYGLDTSLEGRMIINCLLEVTKQGIGQGKTPIYPLHVFRVKSGINYQEDDLNYDMLVKASQVVKIRPCINFAFMDSKTNKDYDYHNSSLQVTYGSDMKMIKGLKKDYSLQRINIATTSINLLALANKNNDSDKFIEEVTNITKLTLEQLKNRYNYLKVRPASKYPFLFGQGIIKEGNQLKSNDMISEFLYDHNLSISIYGLIKALDELGLDHQVGLKVLENIREVIKEKRLEDNLNYQLIWSQDNKMITRFNKVNKVDINLNQISLEDTLLYQSYIDGDILWQDKSQNPLKSIKKMYEKNLAYGTIK